MSAISANEAIKKINAYLSSESAYPFFVIVDGSADYTVVLNHFASLGHIRVSDYCNDNSFADYDKLYDAIGSNSHMSVLLGLGDIITLSGYTKALGKISNLILCGKLVVLCRGIHAQILKMNETDKKFNSRRYCEIQSTLDYTVIRIKPEVSFPSEINFKKLLRSLEDGKGGIIYAKTNLPISASHSITSPYEAIKETQLSFPVRESALPSELWAQFNEDDSLDGYELLDWRTYLRLSIKPVTNAYLKKVMGASPTYDEYKKQIFNVILDIPRKNKDFNSLYMKRKVLLKDMTDNDVANYVAMSLQKDADRIFYLTDNTSVERFAIIEELSKLGTIPAELPVIYPALSKYLVDYTFSCKNSHLFTQYFSQYKRQKLTNVISESFLDKVINLATDGNRVYTGLDTRGSIVEKLNDGKNELYWIDALGVEYLGYIQTMAKELGLLLTIQIGRAVLPTLTCLNRDFYDEWKGGKTQTKKLDDIKHKGEQDFNYEKQKLPIHLAEELKVIDKALEWAKDELLQNRTSKVVIASDHGASRLAVINNIENKWEMATTGLHSGRCCPTNEINEKPVTATDEHGFWVLANYDRFRGGRKASVEVHGGASLEEVLVPIIEISLANGIIELKNMTETAWSSWDEAPFIEIFSPAKINKLSLRFNGHIYKSIPIGEKKHRIVFDDFKRSGIYTADVLDGDNLIGVVTFKIEKRSGKTQAAEEDEFFK